MSVIWRKNFVSYIYFCFDFYEVCCYMWHETWQNLTFLCVYIIIIIIIITTGTTALCEPWPSSGFLNNLIFTVWGCLPHTQPTTWRTRVSLFVCLDLSGLGSPTSSYATAGIALSVSGALKPHHHKVGIALVGIYIYIFVYLFILTCLPSLWIV
jgi:hypothetical protein